MTSVIAVPAAIAGARKPVLRADCWSANPTSAETISTYVESIVRIATRPPPSCTTKTFVTAAWSP